MQASDFTPLVVECCSEVLDSMYFTTVLDASSSVGHPSAPQADELAFSLRFRGEVHGTFGVLIGVSMARMLAANFLGEEEEALTEIEIAEVVGELANMLCGSIVSRVEGKSKFALSHPEPFMAAPTDLESLFSRFETDNGMIHTWIAIDADCLDAAADQTVEAVH
jgi:CheY-specific phosphatase CheX